MADAIKGAVRMGGDGQSGTLPGPGGAYELWRVFDNEPLASTGTVDSIVALPGTAKGLRIGEFEFFGIWVQATSASGTAEYLIQILESWDDTAANYAVPVAGGTILAATAIETPQIATVAPVPMPWLRFRATGSGSNPADTLITLYFWCQS